MHISRWVGLLLNKIAESVFEKPHRDRGKTLPLSKVYW